MILPALNIVSLFLIWNLNIETSLTLPNYSIPPEVEHRYELFDTLRTDRTLYRWPAQRNLLITSSFGDFRQTHFHAGVDVSTFGKIGLPVYASREGSVALVSVSPYGYGKMILLRHPDGFYTRYAHLSRFNRKIETVIRNAQKKKGVYPVDIELQENEIFVQQGELIAYTGNTGAGDEHLHFEILDENQNPVDPLLFPDIASLLHDDQAPQFRSIALTPLTENSTVNGTHQPLVVDVVKKSSGEYSISKAIEVRGCVGLSVHASDQYRYGGYRNQCKRLQCYLDDSLTFQLEIKRIPDADYQQIALHYDYSLISNGKQYFQRLYVEPGNRLPLYARRPAGSGIINTSLLTSGSHKVKIYAYDESQNSSVVTFAIKTLSDNSFPTLSENFSQPAPLDAEEESIPEYEISFSQVGATTSSIDLSAQLKPDYLLVQIDSYLPFSNRPTVWFTSTHRRVPIDILADGSRSYVGTIGLQRNDGGLIYLEAVGDVNSTRNVSTTMGMVLIPIVKEKGARVHTSHLGASFFFPPNGVHRTFYCKIDSMPMGFSFQPDIVLLDKKVGVEVFIPDSLQNSRVGLFHTTLRGTKLLDWRTPSGKNVLKGELQHFLGDVFLQKDDMPPALSNISIKASRQSLRFSFRISDDVAGVDEETIRVTLDGEPIIPEYDPYRKYVFFSEGITLRTGKHSLVICASDRMGNAVERERNFVVQ